MNMMHAAWVELNAMDREDIAALLAKAGSSLTVKSLLDNLQLTVEFESTMAKKWATSVRFDLSPVVEDIVTSRLVQRHDEYCCSKSVPCFKAHVVCV